MRKLDKFLKAWTGRDSRFWMNYIGQVISRNVKSIKGYNLQSGDPRKWMTEVVLKVGLCTIARCQPEADENLAAARVVSLILTLWFYRVARAKCYDPRRPVKGRRESLKRLVEYNHLLADCLVDESRDGEFFPEQEWDMPFGKTTRYTPDDAELERQRYSEDAKKPKRKSRRKK